MLSIDRKGIKEKGKGKGKGKSEAKSEMAGFFLSRGENRAGRKKTTTTAAGAADKGKERAKIDPENEPVGYHIT